MKLLRFSAFHYKSLNEVKVNLHPNITVIVGPNSVGKSNLVDSMRFIRDAFADDLDHAMVTRGGITRIRQQTTSGGRPFNITFEVDAEETFEVHEEKPATYLVEIRNIKGGEFRVEKEHSTWWQEQDNIKSFAPEDTVITQKFFSRDRFGKLTSTDYVEPTQTEQFDQLALADMESEADGNYRLGLSDFFSRWQFATLYPTTFRELRTPDSETALREDGSNWATVIRASKKTVRGKKNLERINEMMRKVLPDFLGVNVDSVGSFLVPKFIFGSANTSVGQRKFDPVQLSDGTLRIYGILLSLYQIPAPPLLVIEEPEQTVHPGVLAMLAEAFKEVSENTQIIVTTHSPQLVDHFAVEQIRVVTMEDGETKIAALKKSQREAVQLGLIGLGEFMAAEGLFPEPQA